MDEQQSERRRGALDPDWPQRAFRRAYLDAYAHRDVADARRDVAALAGWLGEELAAGPLLDVGAGPGRHLVALRERGWRAFGVERARELAAAAPVACAGRLALADGARLPLGDRTCVGALFLFQVLAHGTFEDDVALLAEAARVLRPGGFAVIDLLEPARVARQLVRRERRSLPSGELVVARRIARGRVRKRVRIVGERAGEVTGWTEDVRLVGAAELARVVERAGLALERLAGHLDGRPHAPGAPRLVALARRPR